MRTAYFIAVASFLLEPVGASAQSTADARIAELERIVAELRSRVETLEARGASRQPTKALTAVGSGNPKEIGNWRQLRSGMAEPEVEGLLGAPGKVDVNEYFFTWYYNYPAGGSVQFDAKSRRVQGWREP